jgi:hypothetical protein
MSQAIDHCVRFLFFSGYDALTDRLPVWLVLARARLQNLFFGSPVGGSPSSQQSLSLDSFSLATSSCWYRIDAAASELGYAPLWSMKEGLLLTLRSYSDLRKPRPSREALATARRGNLVALGLVADPEVCHLISPSPPCRCRHLRPSTSQVQASSSRTIGANDSFRDPSLLPMYTAEQVAAHSTRSDVWVSIGGFVYDLSPFVELHPGGDAILNHAGGDATLGFRGPQHPSHVATTVNLRGLVPFFGCGTCTLHVTSPPTPRSLKSTLSVDSATHHRSRLRLRRAHDETMGSGLFETTSAKV